MTNRNIIFKKMTEDDLKLLYQWFQIPHILKWYARNEKYTLEMILEKYLPRLNNRTISSFIIRVDNYPVGYIQLYQITNHLPQGIADYNHPLFNSLKPDELVGIDLFIADEKYLHTGLGSEALKIFLDAHIKDKFSGVLVDPLKENSTAISFFEINDFKHLASQDTKHDLMLLTTATKKITL